MSSATSEKHKEFLRKHYELLKEYGCAIQFNADEGGMCIIDASHRQPNRVAVMHPKLVTDDDRWDVEWRTAMSIIESIFAKWKETDKSFMEKPSPLEAIFGNRTYSEKEVRQIWHTGVSCGISIGLDNAPLEGRKIELMSRGTSQKHKEFLRKHYELLNEYGCVIQYNPYEGGMCIIDEPNRAACRHAKVESR